MDEAFWLPSPLSLPAESDPSFKPIPSTATLHSSPFAQIVAEGNGDKTADSDQNI